MKTKILAIVLVSSVIVGCVPDWAVNIVVDGPSGTNKSANDSDKFCMYSVSSTIGVIGPDGKTVSTICIKGCSAAADCVAPAMSTRFNPGDTAGHLSQDPDNSCVATCSGNPAHGNPGGGF